MTKVLNLPTCQLANQMLADSHQIQQQNQPVQFEYLEDGNHTLGFLNGHHRIWVQVENGKVTASGLELEGGGNLEFRRSKSLFVPPARREKNWKHAVTWTGNDLHLILESEVTYDGEDDEIREFESFQAKLIAR